MRFAPPFGVGLDDTDSTGRYLPSPDQVLTVPTAGTFYQVKKGDLPIRVAAKAYGDKDKKAGLYLFNASTWNDKIRKASTGWESYKIKGLQFQPAYKGPRSVYLSGNNFPVSWLPPPGGGEPEDIYAPKPPPVKPEPKPPKPPPKPPKPPPQPPKPPPKPPKPPPQPPKPPPQPPKPPPQPPPQPPKPPPQPPQPPKPPPGPPEPAPPQPPPGPQPPEEPDEPEPQPQPRPRPRPRPRPQPQPEEPDEPQPPGPPEPAPPQPRPPQPPPQPPHPTGKPSILGAIIPLLLTAYASRAKL